MTDPIAPATTLKAISTQGVAWFLVAVTWIFALVEVRNERKVLIETQEMQAQTQSKLADAVCDINTTFRKLQETSEASQIWKEQMLERIEKIEQQTRFAPQSSAMHPRTLPAHDHRETYTPTREEYDRATMPDP